jgi:predicted amidohydrolase YtcJ
LYVLAPIVLFGVACGLSSAFRKQTLCLIAISILFLPQGFITRLNDYRRQIAGTQGSLSDVVTWLNANLPDRPLVMVHDAGYVAYAGHAVLVDLVGLKTPAAMEFHKRTTYPSVGLYRSKAIAEIADAFHPQYLLVLQDWDRRFGLVEALRGRGWTTREVYAGRAPPETPAANIYHLYELRSPAADVAG